jgi:bifunctional enzyme CysN/CysC
VGHACCAPCFELRYLGSFGALVVTENVVRHAGHLSRDERWAALGATGAVVWFTGLSGSGKSTVAYAAERQLVERGRFAVVLDGDNLRHGLNADLDFSSQDRVENLRRVAEVAALFAESGVVAIVPVISPYQPSRDAARAVVEGAGLRFVEVFVDTPLALCEQRDPKGLYAKARAGEIRGFTGIDDPYEAPTSPELVVTPEDGDPDEQAAKLLAHLSL